MKLNELSDNPGARHRAKRVGRGEGSGTGKTSGSGQKGQKSRSGVAIKGFEGGQMPLHRRLPKRGFNNIFRKRFVAINVGRIQAAIDAGKLDAAKPVTADALRDSGVIKNPFDGVRLLADGDLSAKITAEVAGASKGAVAAIEKAGGSVTLTIAPKDPEAPSRKRRKNKERAGKKAEKVAPESDSAESADA